MICEHSLAASLREFTAKGLRTLLVTSCAPAEGKSSIVAQLGHTLAETGREGVVLVDADQFHPTLHRIFNLSAERGLGELLEEVFLFDLTKEDGAQFGLGDWFEILRAQGRTGELTVSEDGRSYSVRFLKGSICSLHDQGGSETTRLGDVLIQRGRLTLDQRENALRVQQETGRSLGDILRTLDVISAADLTAALHEQASRRATELVALKQPACRFSELVEPYLPAAGGGPPLGSDGDGVDRIVNGRFREYLRSPFLTSQIPSYLSDTRLPRLKVLTAGARSCDLQTMPYDPPFRILMRRLARVFDIVLIDAPPVSITSPTGRLASHADGVLLVVQADSSDVRSIRKAIDELRRAGATVLGAVLNRVDVTADDTLSPFYGTLIAEDR